MARPRTVLHVAGAVLGLIVLAGFAAALYHFRPLVPSRAYKAMIETPAGGQVKAPVYSMLGKPSWVFVRVPESHFDPERPASMWFVWDRADDTVSWAWGQLDSPYLHRNHDLSRGIDLLDGKMEDHWQIKHGGRSVWFSNDRQTISVEPSQP